MISFLSTTRNSSFQNDLLDVLISLLESPGGNDQLFLLLFEPNIADGLYSLIVQTDYSEIIQKKVLKIIRHLLKTKKVYDKNKARIRLDECGTYAGLISKLTSEYSHYFAVNCAFNDNLPIELLENFLQDETTTQNYENLWHILSMLTLSPVTLITDPDQMVRIRVKSIELVFKFVFSNPNNIRQLTKSPSWQDIICQFLCYKKKEVLNQGSNLPPIIVSSSSMINEMSEDGLDNESDEWENLEMTNDEKSSEEKSLLTSTPSKIKKKLKKNNQVTSTLMKNAVNNRVKKLIKMGSADEQNYTQDEDKIKIDSFSFSPELNSTSGQNETDKAKEYLIKSQESDELFEKVLYLIHKLIWESVQGTTIDAWKVLEN